ncbi:MAG: hypothetical protein OYH77_02790 [Pseudomonadota bacterium]|nr:hypothetical protein [Pseudomonadota bacterium]
MTKKVIIILSLFSLPLQTQATQITREDIGNRVQTANSYFDAGDYQQAVDTYLALIDGGHINGHLFYNLGVAYYHMQRLGEAMAAFLAARRYIPRDADVAFNINYLQGQLSDRLSAEVMDNFLNLVNYISSYISAKETSIFSLILLALGLILVTVFMFRRQLIFIFKLGILLVILAIILAILNHTKIHLARQWGAIKNAATAVRSGANPNSVVLFKLNTGAPLAIIKHANTYLKIELSDGRQGWVEASSVASFL